jgi:hypothetical protein
MQEAGRGGRDGLPALAVLVTALSLRNLFYDEALLIDKENVDCFLQENSTQPECCRKFLDSYFDGDTKRTICKTEEAKCNICAVRYYQPARQPFYASRAGVPISDYIMALSLTLSLLYSTTPAPKDYGSSVFVADTLTPAWLPSLPGDSLSLSYALSALQLAIGSCSYYNSPTHIGLGPKRHYWQSVDLTSDASPIKRACG